jgi:hypothetical protein
MDLSSPNLWLASKGDYLIFLQIVPFKWMEQGWRILNLYKKKSLNNVLSK